MLIGFKVSNFRSFLRPQYFTFSASSDRALATTHCANTGIKQQPTLLKSAVMFGPNGSGKTNLLRALATMRALVLNSHSLTPERYASEYSPFQSRESISKPTEFEIELLIAGIRYRYAFAYDAEAIRFERLLVYRTGKSQRWFERHYDTKTHQDRWAPFSSKFSGDRERLRHATRPTMLFLTTAALFDVPALSPLMRWFLTGMSVLFDVCGEVEDQWIARLLDQHRTKHKILELLRGVDPSVRDVRIAEHPLPIGPPTPRPKPSIEFQYDRQGLGPVWLDGAMESQGRSRLLLLVAQLYSAVQQSQCLIIDEFDAGIHPLAARYLLESFHQQSQHVSSAQLVLTCRNVALMDLELLRRDQIWLVDQDSDSASKLLPLFGSGPAPRKRELIARSYLRGRYGGVPMIAAPVRRS